MGSATIPVEGTARRFAAQTPPAAWTAIRRPRNWKAGTAARAATALALVAGTGGRDCRSGDRTRAAAWARRMRAVLRQWHRSGDDAALAPPGERDPRDCALASPDVAETQVHWERPSSSPRPVCHVGLAARGEHAEPSAGASGYACSKS